MLLLVLVSSSLLHRQELEDELAIINERVQKLGKSISILFVLYKSLQAYTRIYLMFYNIDIVVIMV